MTKIIKFRQPIFNEKGEFEKFHYWGCYGEWFHNPIGVGDNSQQNTGLRDKNGNDVYAGDILQYDIDCFYTVVYNESGFYAVRKDINELLESDILKTEEIICNVFTNPELIES